MLQTRFLNQIAFCAMASSSWWQTTGRRMRMLKRTDDFFSTFGTRVRSNGARMAQGRFCGYAHRPSFALLVRLTRIREDKEDSAKAAGRKKEGERCPGFAHPYFWPPVPLMEADITRSPTRTAHPLFPRVEHPVHSDTATDAPGYIDPGLAAESASVCSTA